MSRRYIVDKRDIGINSGPQCATSPKVIPRQTPLLVVGMITTLHRNDCFCVGPGSEMCV